MFTNTVRSRVSRETRQLLTAALVALLALWVLARIRFPGPPSGPNPIPNLLAQLSTPPRFASLGGEIAELQGRLASSWLSIPVSTDDSAESGSRRLPAMRLQRSTAVIGLRSSDRLPNEREVLAFDRASGLAAGSPGYLPLAGAGTWLTPLPVNFPFGHLA